MADLAQHPDRLAAAQAACAVDAAGQYSIVAMARRLHLALKDSGLVHQIGLLPKVDIVLDPEMPEVHLVPPLGRQELMDKVATLETRVEELEALYMGLLNSKSVKMTAPFRGIKAKLKKLVGR